MDKPMPKNPYQEDQRPFVYKDGDMLNKAWQEGYDAAVQEHESKAILMSPGAICSNYQVQNCHYCERLECGDNMSPAKKAIELLREISEHLKEESFDATAVWLSDRYQGWEKEAEALLNTKEE